MTARTYTAQGVPHTTYTVARPRLPNGDLPLTDADHTVWQEFCRVQVPYLRAHAHPLIAQGFDALALPPDRFPTLGTLARFLGRQGWAVAVDDGTSGIGFYDFLQHFAHRRVPTMTYVRSPDFTHDAPHADMLHDLVSHSCQLANPAFAAFVQDFASTWGHGTPALEPALERLYFFTIEQALVHHDGQLKILGAGMIDNHLWSKEALDPNTVDHRPFDLKTVLNTPFVHGRRPDVYFTFPSLEAFYALAALDRREALGMIEKAI